MDITQLIEQGSYQREYRINTLPYSLNPALAYAVNILSEPTENDRVLDPCCGSGTILIERQQILPCICVGVDINSKNLGLAEQNTKAANVKVEFKHGDITEKKFPEGYFTKIISNLPYGIKSGSRQENIKLYKFLTEASTKWLKKDGKAIFITTSKKLLRNAFAEKPNLKFLEEYKIKNSGLDLNILIYQKI